MDEQANLHDMSNQNAKGNQELVTLLQTSISNFKNYQETQKLSDLHAEMVRDSTEITAIKKSLDHINKHITLIEDRLHKIELVHGSEISRQKARFDFVKLIDAIGKMAIMAVLFSIFIVNPIDVHDYLFGHHDVKLGSSN